MKCYPVCPCCDAGRDEYDAAGGDDDPEIETIEETCDECMGGKAHTVYMRDPEMTIGERNARLDIIRPLLPRGAVRILRGGNYVGHGAYQTVRWGWADAIEPHCEGAQLERLQCGSPYNFSVWASVAPGMSEHPIVAEYLSLLRD